MSTRLLIIAALAGLGAASARADELVGADGSRLRGTWVKTQNGHHIFDSTLLGRVEVPTEGASIVRDSATALASAPESQREASWSADVSARLDIDRGSLETPDDDLDATLRLERATGRGEWLGEFDYSHRRTAGERVDDDVTASVSYDRLRGPRSFAAGRIYGTRELRSDGTYDATQTASFALGWRGWEGPQRYLRVAPALGYLAIERGGAHFDGGAVGLYARGRGPVVGKLTFNAELQFLDTLGEGRYADLALQLRHPLSERLYLALAWDYTWSDLAIESGVSSEWHWVLGWKSNP